jgi:hypothetical protein
MLRARMFAGGERDQANANGQKPWLVCGWQKFVLRFLLGAEARFA